MSRSTWEATVAQAEARGAARREARARRSERLAEARRARKRARRLAARHPRPPKPPKPKKRKRPVLTAEERRARDAWRKRRDLARTCRDARARRREAARRRLRPEVATVYATLPRRSELRVLILAQAADERRPFDSHGPDFAKVLAVVGRR